MIQPEHTYLKIEAGSAFRSASRRAWWYDVCQDIRGRPADLLPFGVIASALHLYNRVPLGIRQVPLDAIVGSVDRAGDFTRNLLPRREYLRERWSRVYAHVSVNGFDPVSLYKVGNIYFVNDGNHRLSVLRAMQASTVEADVTEFPCRAPLHIDFRLRELPQKVAYLEFLDQTDLDINRPELVEILLSDPVSYRKLEEHIAGHAYWIEYSTGRDVTVYRAASSWYDLVFLPTISLIRTLNLPRSFPKMTEADLYVALTQHHRQLVRGLERAVPLSVAAEHFRRTAARPQLRRLWYQLTRKNPIRAESLPQETPASPGARAYRTLPTRTKSDDRAGQ
jgi:hypothetical protein